VKDRRIGRVHFVQQRTDKAERFARFGQRNLFGYD
jgi:hypothetical protein